MPTPKMTGFGGPCIICGERVAGGTTKNFEDHFLKEHTNEDIPSHQRTYKKQQPKVEPEEMFDRSEYLRQPYGNSYFREGGR